MAWQLINQSFYDFGCKTRSKGCCSIRKVFNGHFNTRGELQKHTEDQVDRVQDQMTAASGRADAVRNNIL